MLEELFKWRVGNAAAVPALNEESARVIAQEEGRPYKRGHTSQAGKLSHQGMFCKLRAWYGRDAPAIGTVGKYMRLVNCDNAGYFFARLGERDWKGKGVPFTMTEIQTGFYGTCSASCPR